MSICEYNSFACKQSSCEYLLPKHEFSEVINLKDKIAKLEKLVGKLTVENEFLKTGWRVCYVLSALEQISAFWKNDKQNPKKNQRYAYAKCKASPIQTTTTKHGYETLPEYLLQTLFASLTKERQIQYCSCRHEKKHTYMRCSRFLPPLLRCRWAHFLCYYMSRNQISQVH